LRPFPNAAYGTSKAALNYLTRKMHYEHENLIVFPIDPG
jgi:norsolorinic acid ketoreductase